MLYTLFLFFSSWICADFLSGLYHWVQDRYMSPDSRFRWVSLVASDNEQHHAKPTQMTIKPYLETVAYSLMAAAPVLLLMFLLLEPGPFKQFAMLTIGFLASANMVHRLAHTPASKLPDWVVWLQSTGFFLPPDQHEMHHRSWATRKLVDKEQARHRYCAMSGWVNPVLDQVRFFDHLESFLLTFGIAPLPATPDS